MIVRPDRDPSSALGGRFDPWPSDQPFFERRVKELIDSTPFLKLKLSEEIFAMIDGHHFFLGEMFNHLLVGRSLFELRTELCVQLMCVGRLP